MPQSPAYSCTILTSAKEPAGTIPIEAETDADAVLKGSMLGRAHTDYAGYEIRDGDRILYMRVIGTHEKL